MECKIRKGGWKSHHESVQKPRVTFFSQRLHSDKFDVVIQRANMWLGPWLLIEAQE